MKKFFVATSALVAAGSAAALEVTLGGEIEFSSSLDTSASGFTGADVAANLTVTAAGESMGWTYGGSVTVGTSGVSLTSAQIYFGGDFMGKITAKDGCGDFMGGHDDVVAGISGTCIEWTGLDLAGFSVEAAAALDAVAAGAESVNVGATYDLGIFSIGAELDNQDGGNYDLDASTSVGTASVAIGASGALNDIGAFGYDVTVGLDVLGWAAEAAIDPVAKTVGLSASSGCFSADLDLDGTASSALVSSWEFGYDCPLHEGFDVALSIGQEASDADLTGDISATVSF